MVEGWSCICMAHTPVLGVADCVCIGLQAAALLALRTLVLQCGGAPLARRRGSLTTALPW